jgi:hypothetical protein
MASRMQVLCNFCSYFEGFWEGFIYKGYVKTYVCICLKFLFVFVFCFVGNTNFVLAPLQLEFALIRFACKCVIKSVSFARFCIMLWYLPHFDLGK